MHGWLAVLRGDQVRETLLDHMCITNGGWSSKNTLRLKDMVTLIAPASAHLLVSAHTAGADAQMHVAVYYACLELAGIE